MAKKLLRSVSRREYKSVKSRESGADALDEFRGIRCRPSHAGGFVLRESSWQVGKSWCSLGVGFCYYWNLIMDLGIQEFIRKRFKN